MKIFILLFLIFSTTYGKLSVFVENEKIENEKILKLDPNDSFFLSSKENEYSSSVKNVVDDKIIEYLEQAREKFGEGFEESGIPPLDPYKIENVDIEISQKPLVSANFNLSNITVVGLQDFIIEVVHFSIIGLTFKYEFIVPQLLYTSQFSIDGKMAAVIPLNTTGDVRLQANRMHIAGNATLGTTLDGYLLLRKFIIDFDIEETEVYISNIISIGQVNDALNWIFNQLSDDFFQGQRDRLNEYASEILFEILGEAISKINLADLIGKK